MKFFLYTAAVIACSFVIYSCSNSDAPAVKPVQKDTTAEKQKFFPVTSYLKGEIFNIKQSGINPLKYTIINDHTDSVWLKVEALDTAFSEFLRPVIDSTNLITLFTEKSFMDQSIDAITLTYEPSAELPDSMHLKRWDIYIDPKTSNVKRIYMVKEIDQTKTLQLTWVSRQWCKIVSILTDKNGFSKIEKEEKFILDF